MTMSGRASRKYFEVFGDALAETIFLRNLTIALAGACLTLAIALARVAQRPPLVIRVDQLHAPAAIADVEQQAGVTGPEVSNFATHFTRDALGWDLYSLDDDINRALAMMTPDAAVRMKQRLDGLRVAQLVKDHSLRTKVVIAEISVEKDTPHVVRVKVRGTRIAQSYDDKQYRKETIFEDTLVAQKVPRTQAAPWGLLVADWSENIYKETP